MSAEARQAGGPAPGTIVRWLWVWIGLGLLVVVVVIGFLVGIDEALASIDDGLGEATEAVVSVQGNTDPLPGLLQTINTNLGGVSKVLKPIPGQANQIADGLVAIRGSLVPVSGSLVDTAGSLTDTAGSLTHTSTVLVGVAGTTGDINRRLNDTSDILGDVRDTARQINSTLIDAQRVDSRGTADIPINVRRVNDQLRPVREDTGDIVDELRGVNRNLTAICQSPVLRLLPPFRC